MTTLYFCKTFYIVIFSKLFQFFFMSINQILRRFQFYFQNLTFIFIFRAMTSLKRRKTRPAHMVAANLKDSSSTDPNNLTITHSTLSDLEPSNDRSIILHEFQDFESILEQISDKTMMTFIGNQEYLDKVRLKLGEPHLQVETRIKELKTIGEF